MSLPILNLDDKTFETLVEEAKKRIPIYAPEWTDHNVHDPGITLIQLFAWLTEMQIYRLNKVTDENKWKFLQLMGITRKNNENSKTLTLEEAILRARRDLKTAYRAVTSADYEYLLLQAPAEDKPEIARAKAIPRYHPNHHQEVPGIVTIVVVPKSEQAADNAFLKRVYHYLDSCRLLTTELFVFFPPYVTAAVDAEIAVKPQYLENTVIENVKTRLREFLDTVRGGPDFSGWPFGRPVYLSEVYQVIDNVEGVDYAKNVRLKIINEQGNVIETSGDIIIPKHGLMKPADEDKFEITLIEKNRK